MFPEVRMRRLRRNPTLRRMVRETRLAADDFIMPLFVRPGSGVPAIILFGIPEHKDAEGSGAYADDAIVCRAIEAVKKACRVE